ncbi:MAG TPA: DUF427 domain-containing protein [Candidatus Binatia bacterium]|jgi:uncharacterized protein (DUF427 family)
MWVYIGDKRPPFAETAGPGQESVWDYPRPPKLVADHRRIIVRLGDLLIAESHESYRILETAGPPTFYISPQDVHAKLLKPFPGTSICEWKGEAKYWKLETSTPAREAIAWSYPRAQAPYGAISGHYSFYPGRVECFVDSERVRPQPGYFYGGWITNEIVGPWKGDPGTEGW